MKSNTTMVLAGLIVWVVIVAMIYLWSFLLSVLFSFDNQGNVPVVCRLSLCLFFAERIVWAVKQQG